MVSYDPESFDRPVRDYSFKDIDSPARLIDQMSEAGGFTASKLAKARGIPVSYTHLTLPTIVEV